MCHMQQARFQWRYYAGICSCVNTHVRPDVRIAWCNLYPPMVECNMLSSFPNISATVMTVKCDIQQSILNCWTVSFSRARAIWRRAVCVKNEVCSKLRIYVYYTIYILVFSCILRPSDSNGLGILTLYVLCSLCFLALLIIIITEWCGWHGEQRWGGELWVAVTQRWRWLRTLTAQQRIRDSGQSICI